MIRRVAERAAMGQGLVVRVGFCVGFGAALDVAAGADLDGNTMRICASAAESASSSLVPAGMAFILRRYEMTSAYCSGARLPGSFLGICVLMKPYRSPTVRSFHHLAKVTPVCEAAVWHDRQVSA